MSSGPDDRQVGRVLRRVGERLTLQRPGGAVVQVHATSQAEVGDLVSVYRGVAQRVFAHPSGDFPPAGGDALRLAGRWDRLRARADALSRTRAFFDAQGFLEVETPLVVESPGTETHLQAVPVQLTPRPGVSPEARWLITSPELHMKRLLAAGAPPIYQLCKVFRDGERGARHRPEFTMIEWYRPWSGYQAIMDDCEAWIRSLAGDQLDYAGRAIDLRPGWPRRPFAALLREAGVDPAGLSPDDQLEAFATEVEPELGRERPLFVVDYPIELASLARPRPDDPSLAERFELYIGGLELANGFGELTDAAVQRARCEAENGERQALGLPTYPLAERFLEALEHGMPPSGGVAVGFDRLLMLLTGAERIDEVLAF